MDGEEKKVDRRRFLGIAVGASAAAAAGIGGLAWWRHRAHLAALAPVITDRPGMVEPSDVVTERRRLGRTNLQVSVVGVGAARPEVEAIVRAADKGINFLDTSICYGNSEEIIRRAFEQNKGLRDKYVIATKWDPGRATTKAEMLASLDKSLMRLGVDVIDIMQVHWLGGGHVVPDDGFNRLDNADIPRAIEDARKAGKVRFFGATSHDGNRSRILAHAVDQGIYDMILVKMNVLDYENAGMPALLAKCREKDVGVVVMKSQPGGGRVPAEYEKSKWSIFQANLRWVLAHPEVACVVHSKIGTEAEAQDQAVAATKEKLGRLDRELLEQYASALSGAYCRECSGGCTDACPAGVAIPHVAHLAMYDRDYGWHDYAGALYREMPAPTRWSETCASCNKCTDACPYGVDAASLVRGVHRSLG
jgi:predicted aldo/keto reductase-like oxidoreductase